VPRPLIDGHGVGNASDGDSAQEVAARGVEHAHSPRTSRRAVVGDALADDEREAVPLVHGHGLGQQIYVAAAQQPSARRIQHAHAAGAPGHGLERNKGAAGPLVDRKV
jgi:hypothetical protein